MLLNNLKVHIGEIVVEFQLRLSSKKIMRSPKVLNHEILGALNFHKLKYVAQRQTLVACGAQVLLDHSVEEKRRRPIFSKYKLNKATL